MHEAHQAKVDANQKDIRHNINRQKREISSGFFFHILWIHLYIRDWPMPLLRQVLIVNNAAQLL